MMELKTLLKRSETKIATLHPTLQGKAFDLLIQAYKEGILLRVTHGLRTMEEQAELYAKGRTKPGRIITKAKPGYSYHNYGLAFDICVLGDPDGKTVDWNPNAYQRPGTIGRGLGLEWGGSWNQFPDVPHFQYTFGLTLTELRAGKRPPQPTIKKEEPKLEPWEQEFIDAVKWVKENKISDGTMPKENVTREQMWVMLYRLYQKIKPTA